MLGMQKNLLVHYIQIEGLKQYPIDLNERDNQKLIKDFIRRFIEELCEAYECLYYASACVTTNKSDEARVHIVNYNQEIADAWHFLLEILIYCNVDEYKLDGAIERKFDENGLDALYRKDDPLQSLYNVGGFYNQGLGHNEVKRSRNMFRIYTHQETLEDPKIRGSFSISPEALTIHAKFLWFITYDFNMAANQLKNKEWAQSDIKVNEIQFQEKLFKGLETLITYFDFADLSFDCLYQNYDKKNKINHERIKGGY